MNTFKIELEKLYRRKSTRNLLIFYSIVLLLITLGYFLGEASYGLNILNAGQFVTASLTGMMGFLLPFICLYIVATSFISDFNAGTIKNMFLLPVKKQDIFVGKLLSVQTLMGILLIIQLIITLVFALLLDGGFTLVMFGVAIGHYLGAFVILGLVNVSGAALSLLVKSTGLTLLIAYVGFVGMRFLTLYLPALRSIMLSNILTQYNQIFSSFNLSLLLSVFAYYIILVLCGNLLFEKKEARLCQFD